MAESGIPYSLITPRGTLVFNDYVKPSFYGLTSVAGLESNVRVTVKPRPARDGDRPGKAKRGSMYPVVQGQYVGGPPQVEALRRELTAHAYSILNTWGALQWAPSDEPDQVRQVEVRLNEKLDGGSGQDILKGFSLPLITQFPIVMSASQFTADTALVSAGTGGGLTFPLTFPLDFGDPSAGGVGVFTNVGEFETYPTLQIHGPITSPSYINDTTNQILTLTGVTIAAGDYAEINTWDETITMNGDDDYSLMQYMDVFSSTFWSMVPGPNSLRVSGSAPDPAVTRGTVIWRHGYA